MSKEEIIEYIKQNPEIVPDDVIQQQFHDRGLWDDLDIQIFGIDGCIDYLNENGYNICAQ